MARPDPDPRTPASAKGPSRSARWELVLFAAYLVIYGLFVLLNAFDARIMDTPIGGGINLAVAYGIALIVVAAGLAIAYGWLCRTAGGRVEVRE